MKEILSDFVSKLTRYDWVTTLLPGLFLVCCLRKFGKVDLAGELWHEKFAVIFFAGLVCSRVGASIVEPITRKLFGWKYDYIDYLDWSKSDEKRATLLVTNSNWFRSLVGMILTGIVVLLAREWISIVSARWIGCIVLLGLFADAYRRQIMFIKRCITKHKRELTGQSNIS